MSILTPLTKQLTSEVLHLIVLRGGMRKKELEATQARLAAIPTDEARLLLATGRYVGEGFDDARLDTLFLTLPISWQGTITQYVGRLHRLFHNKREVRVYDYADLNVPMLARMFDRRCRRYEGIGYTIQLPGSAVPGWPADVPLPVDADWKSQYADSVRRLVRDGVDSPMAKLFVNAAVIPPADADSPDRARSATEAFLFRRLETLAETAGRFRLNAELPIPFDGWAVWRSTCFANRRTSPSSLTGDITWATLKPTGEIVARILCCKRTVIGSFASSQKTSANV
jgi:hypothetical protein